MWRHFELYPTQNTESKKQLLSSAAGVFGVASKGQEQVDLVPLHTKIGQQALEIDFYNKRSHQNRVAERRQMIDRSHPLSVKRQAELLESIPSGDQAGGGASGRGAARGICPVWQTRYRQHRPRQLVHCSGVHRRGDGRWRTTVHGRTRGLAR